jgi:ectoine hydroxylase-related dioxygenase (phytanoyl-CoA dioxygenase family)
LLYNNLITEGLVGPFYLSDLSKLGLLFEDVSSNSKELKDRHIKSSIVKDIFNDENLRLNVKKFFGCDLLLWRSNFFIKQLGTDETPWHHDKHFENGDIPLDFQDIENHFSILIAVTDIQESGGVMEFILGSHRPIKTLDRDLRPFHKKTGNEHFIDIPTDIDLNIIQLPLTKGQFVLFHSGLLHRSLPFLNGERRISMIGRLTTKNVKIPEELVSPTSIFPFN